MLRIELDLIGETPILSDLTEFGHRGDDLSHSLESDISSHCLVRPPVAKSFHGPPESNIAFENALAKSPEGIDIT